MLVRGSSSPDWIAFHGHRSSVFQHSLFGDVASPCVCHEASVFKFLLVFLHSFHVTLLFSSFTFHPFAFLSGTSPLKNLRIIFNSCLCSFVSFFSGLHRFINFGLQAGPTMARTLHHAEASLFGASLLTMLCPPKCARIFLASIFASWPQTTLCDVS